MGPYFISYSTEKYQSGRNMKCLALDPLHVGSSGVLLLKSPETIWKVFTAYYMFLNIHTALCKTPHILGYTET